MRINKRKIFDIIESDTKGYLPSRIFDYFIITLILCSVVATIVESFEHEVGHHNQWLYYFEVFTITIFTTEYLLRLWTADLYYPNKPYLQAIFKRMMQPMLIIDLVAIIPFFLPLVMTVDLRFLRVLRTFRLLRIFKLQRYSRALDVVWRVLNAKKHELGATLFLAFILLIMSSTIMYYVESDENPEFSNILRAFWWTIVTLTTVGYGDVVPVTWLGKIISSFIAVIGIGIVALPTGILSSGFLYELEKEKERKAYELKKLQKAHKHRKNNDSHSDDDDETPKKRYCPHCGEKIYID
ncbi:MAG: ion transporter [Bernardetiaceae bacterium]|nr:ion transporter [Bernardetiaceae bacterium]